MSKCFDWRASKAPYPTDTSRIRKGSVTRHGFQTIHTATGSFSRQITWTSNKLEWFCHDMRQDSQKLLGNIAEQWNEHKETRVHTFAEP